MSEGLRQLIAQASEILSRAGVSSPRVDAEELAAHVLEVPRTRLGIVDPVPGFEQRYMSLVEQRRQRIPLQHLTGIAAFGPIEVTVGPGVFIPRPETESLFDWAARNVSGADTVVDLCAGSGALAIALAHVQPGIRVIAVERSDEALTYTRRNAANTRVEVMQADIADPLLLAELDGMVDLVVANPPYIPDHVELEPEVVHHDPPSALFAGADGLAVIAPLVTAVARLLAPGGLVGVEHDETNGGGTADLFAATGLFGEITQHRDLAGRPRFVTARRAAGKN